MAPPTDTAVEAIKVVMTEGAMHVQLGINDTLTALVNALERSLVRYALLVNTGGKRQFRARL